MTRPDDDAEGAQSPKKREHAEPGSDDLKRRLDALDQALGEKSEADKKSAEASKTGTVSGVAQAFRLSSEFIAGIAAGAGIGYVLDTLAGTSPWGLIVFLLLGFVAGVLNVLRSAGLVAQPDERVK